MFDAGFFFGLFAIIPALKRADEVAGDAAKTFELSAKVLLVVFVILLGGGFVTGF